MKRQPCKDLEACFKLKERRCKSPRNKQSLIQNHKARAKAQKRLSQEEGEGEAEVREITLSKAILSSLEIKSNVTPHCCKVECQVCPHQRVQSAGISMHAFKGHEINLGVRDEESSRGIDYPSPWVIYGHLTSIFCP